MKRILLEETKIGESLAIGFEEEGEEIGFTIACYNAGFCFTFECEAWQEFVKVINQANLIKKANDQIS